MDKKGWISIHRCIVDNWIWQEKPFDKGRAWIDLLLMANHTQKKIILGNQIIDVNPGEIITSELKLMKRWSWGKNKLRTFLNILENEKMLIKKSDHKKTTLTIVNWLDYQGLKTTNGPQADHKRTISGPRADTNNNDNNDNNDNKKEKTSKLALDDLTFKYTSNPDLSKAIKDFVDMRKSIKKPLTERALNILFTKLDTLSGGNDSNKIKILENSILNCWQGIFELKPEQKEKTQEEILREMMR